jgi:hypothetical protein
MTMLDIFDPKSTIEYWWEAEIAWWAEFWIRIKLGDNMKIFASYF